MIKVPDQEYLYFAYGMKRGGHHAVLNWVLGHYDSWLYCNNCLQLDGQIQVQYDSDIRNKGEKPYEMKLLSFEDRPNFSESSFESICKSYKPKKNILILRDVYNTFASRFQKKRFPHEFAKKQQCLDEKNWIEKWINFNDVSIWKKYALEFVGETNFMGDAIKIKYNSWFSNKQYRIELSKNFSHNFTDVGLEDVLDFGLGSSFDQLKFHKKAQQMNVISRWKEFYKDEEYINCVTSDKEIEKLNKEIFNLSIPKIYL